MGAALSDSSVNMQWPAYWHMRLFEESIAILFNDCAKHWYINCGFQADLRSFAAPCVRSEQTSFSSVIIADVTNVGDPRLVIPVHMAHATFSIGLLVFFLKGGPTWETYDWPVVPYNASYTLNGLSLPPRLLCCVFVSCLWRGSFVSVFGGSRLERCQSTSRHGTCRCYAQSSLMH